MVHSAVKCWPENMHDAHSIDTKDEMSGLWILCRGCIQYKEDKSICFASKDGKKILLVLAQEIPSHSTIGWITVREM